MFASKMPSDVNQDPEPFVVTYGGENEHRTGDLSTSGDPFDGKIDQYVEISFDPRPEFDHVQHNEPNPILVDFRNWKPKDLPRIQDRARFWIPALRGGAEARRWAGFTYPHTAEHAAHARRVLARLVRLTAGASA